MRIQRHKQRGSTKRYVYTYPTRAAPGGGEGQSEGSDAQDRRTSRSTVLLHRLNPVLRGWTNYHRHGAAAKTFAYLAAYTWRRVWRWLRHKHPKATVA